jgi:CoA:oxalate CoA-transferase
MSEGPLHGLQVVELGPDLSGAYCGKLLADLGAEVIKVEPPGIGDECRAMRPFKDDIAGPERSGLFLYLNTNKLGITLDIEQVAGRDILLDLLRDTDVLIETLAINKSRALALDYPSLRERLPRLVMTSISPYGQTGPHSTWRGAEITLWNASGYGVLTPAGTHEEEEPPLHPHAAQVAYMSATLAAGATMAALLDRELQGEGQQVEISEQETMIAALSPQLADFYYDGNVVWTRDSPRLNTMKFIPCKDGYVSMLITQPDQWQRLVEWMGSPEWLQAVEYRGTNGMAQNWDVISFMFAEMFAGKTKEEIFAEGQAHHIPIGPVNSIPEAVSSQHLGERRYFVTVDHPEIGPVTMPGAPYRFTEAPWQIRRPAPALGQDNVEIYSGRLGYSVERLAELAGVGAI